MITDRSRYYDPALAGKPEALKVNASSWRCLRSKPCHRYHKPMSEPLSLDPDEILSYAPELDPSSGEATGVMVVVFRDGTERRFEGDELEQVLPALGHVTPPTA